MCKVLVVSRSGYYKWLRTREVEPPAKVQQLTIVEAIKEIFESSRGRYGSPRVHQELLRRGFSVCVNTVAKLMRQQDLHALRKRKFRKTTDSNHDNPIAPNRLDRKFSVNAPNEVWVTDITYVQTGEGWLYLAAFIDLYSRRVVGWSLSESIDTQLVLDAFQMALARRGKAAKLVHSDRGCQYASADFRRELKKHKCQQSMSRKGNCWDNAVAESFFGSLKTELIYCEIFSSRKVAHMLIFEYIEIFFNRFRLHSALNYLTPEEKEQKDRKVA